MYKKSHKKILKYFLQLLLLTFPIVTIINVITINVSSIEDLILPFSSPIAMFTTKLNYFFNATSVPTFVDCLLIFIGEIPCILICILYFVSFLGVKNKKNQALTYLQYFAIIEAVLLMTNTLYASVYVVLFLMLIYRKEYLIADEDN